MANNNEIQALSDDIHTITAEINAYQRVAGEAIFEIGRRLKHVKENDLVHGEWSKWCKEEIGMDRTQADKFIRVVGELGNEFTYTQLGLNALYQIATLPETERNQSHTTAKGEQKKPEDMTVRELRDLKRQINAERRERERLEEENEILAEKASKPPKIETRTEYVTPADYDEVKRENDEFRRKYGDGKSRIIEEGPREEFYREFAKDLTHILNKYGSIVFDGDKVRMYGYKDRDYADKINDFDEFWKQHVKTAMSNHIIIESEAN